MIFVSSNVKQDGKQIGVARTGGYWHSDTSFEKEPKVKPLAIAAINAGPFVPPTRETMYRRTYPLSNAVYIYINRPPGTPISPRLKEFLVYILSREGQQDVVDDGMYLPLNPEAAREQREKLK